MSANITTLKAFAKLHDEREALKKKLGAVEKKIADGTDPIVEYLQRQESQRMTIGGRTIYIRRELWPGKEGECSTEDLIKALDDCDLSHTQKQSMNVQKMRSVVNEVVGDTQGDPAEIFYEEYPTLRGVVKISEVFKLGARKS